MSSIPPSRWLEHSNQRLEDARLLLAHNRPETALSSAYFALFYACKALLLARGHDYKTHSSVVGNVGRFPDYRERLNTRLPALLQTERARCDYELVSYPHVHAEHRIHQSNSFVNESREIVE